MNRNLVSCVAAFALMLGATLAMSSPAEAGHGLLKRIHCKKVALFQKLKNRGSGCCDPAPSCCEPAPQPCCAPAPEPCCAPAPEPCCAPEPAPCCGAVEAAPVSDCGCGGSPVAPVEMSYSSEAAPASAGEGFDLAPGEVLVEGSLQTVGASEATAEAAAPAAEEAVPAPQADPATDSPESSSDAVEEVAEEAAEEAAPPAPAPDASTDA